MTTQIKQSGFTHVKAKNMLKEVKRSVEYYMKLAKYTSFICKLTKYLPFPYLRAIYQNYIALQTTADGYPIGLAGYFVHSAEKPFDKLRDK